MDSRGGLSGQPAIDQGLASGTGVSTSTLRPDPGCVPNTRAVQLHLSQGPAVHGWVPDVRAMAGSLHLASRKVARWRLSPHGQAPLCCWQDIRGTLARRPTASMLESIGPMARNQRSTPGYVKCYLGVARDKIHRHHLTLRSRGQSVLDLSADSLPLDSVPPRFGLNRPGRSRSSDADGRSLSKPHATADCSCPLNCSANSFSVFSPVSTANDRPARMTLTSVMPMNPRICRR